MSINRSDKSKGNYTTMSNYHLRDTRLSLKAKGLLSLMLSLPDDWDFSAKGLATLCHEGKDSIESGLKELEKEGYLVRERIRLSDGRFSHIRYEIYEDSIKEYREPNRPKRKKPKRNKSEQDDSKQAAPVSKNHTQLNTDIQNTELTNEKIDKNGPYLSRERIKDQIDYDNLIQEYEADRIDNLVELMLEVVVSKNPYCVIAKEKLPREVVRERLGKVNSDHIEYVLQELEKTTAKVGNVKAYVLASLFNAPVNMDIHDQLEVNHDRPSRGRKDQLN